MSSSTVSNLHVLGMVKNKEKQSVNIEKWDKVEYYTESIQNSFGTCTNDDLHNVFDIQQGNRPRKVQSRFPIDWYS